MSHRLLNPDPVPWEELYEALLGSRQRGDVVDALIRRKLPGYYPPSPFPWLNPNPGVIFNILDATSGPPPAPPGTPPGGYSPPGPGSDPHPFFSDARGLFLSGIALKQVAANLPDGQALASAADQAIADWEDEYCGTPPRPIPTLLLAVSLAAFASTLQAGGLQTAIQQEASRLAQKAFQAAPAAQPAAPNPRIAEST
jgi:hypothetical protein